MTTDPATAPLAPTVDVKPLINRNKDNVTDKVEAVRDRIYDYFHQACAAEGVDAVILKSYPFSVPVWVKFQCWIRRTGDEHLTDRSTAILIILPREFHYYDHEINLEIREGQKIKNYRSIVELDPANVKALVHYMLRRTDFNIFGFKRVRTRWWELWLPRNEVTRLGKDWLGLSMPLLFIIGFLFLLAIPLIGPLVATIGYGLLGLSTPFLYFISSFFLLMFPIIGILLLLAAVGLTVYTSKRRTYFLSPGKPVHEPRRLLRMDSWQTLVRDIGGESQKVKAAVKKELAIGLSEGVQIADEKIWYAGVDGPEEREQIVVTFRRGIGFIHIYSYGKDLYVGWDAHVNAGAWKEKQVADGLEPQTGEYCRVNTIESDWHVPNEYDITDTNCLIEWIHAAVTKVIKTSLAEYKIDQEIDFQILRGERNRVVGSENPEGTKDKAKPLISGLRSKFKREA
jgi:hypothetical protein